MNIKRYAAILFLVLVSSAVVGQKKNGKTPAPFKIVGYYFLKAALNDTANADANDLFLSKITHLNIAFINPDSTGVFQQDLALDTLVKKAHQKNVNVLASIAGGGPHPYYAALLRADNRKKFIANLVSLVQRYNLDGIDVDLEGDDIDSNYQGFVVALAGSLKPMHKLLTAAIATAYKEQLPDKALKQFDFINIMSYDRTGPWRPDKPGHHAPYEMAVDDLNYWHDVRSIPRQKLVLGLPFYGDGFGASDAAVVSMNYNEITALNPKNESDTLTLPGNVTMYYNSLSTIKKKTELALQKGGGVMIWQLLGDAAGDKSLLNAIYGVVQKSKEKNTPEKF